MKKFVAIVMLLAFVTAGCTGSFSLTKKVYNWHRSATDKWYDEFGFLVCAILPIYGISTFADAIIFNSIEFWTGNNPVTQARNETQKKFVRVDNAEATLSYNKSANQLSIASQKQGLQSANITLEKNGDTVLTKDKNGNVLFTTTKNENGEFSVYNKDMKLVKTYKKSDIALAQQQLGQ